jgi:hypothetical protein
VNCLMKQAYLPGLPAPYEGGHSRCVNWVTVLPVRLNGETVARLGWRNALCWLRLCL